MAVDGRSGARVEQAIYQHINSSATSIAEETISHGQMDIESVSSGSVVLQLRPITDQAVQTLLNATKNNKLLEMIRGILDNANIASILHICGSEPIEISLKVFYANSAKANQGRFHNTSNINVQTL